MNSSLAKDGNLLLLSFEDMRKDLEGTISRCLEFLGKEMDPSVIHSVVRNNSLEKMRAKEDQAKRLPKSPGEEGRSVGKGTIAGWRQRLTEPQLAVIDEFTGDMLERLGYARGINNPLKDLQKHSIPNLREDHAATIRNS